MDVRIVGNQFKIIKCDKNQSKNQSRFLGTAEVLLGAFRNPLRLPGGRWRRFGERFGSLWGSLGSPLGAFGGALGVLGVCFADPWDPWGLLGHSRADFWIFLRNYGSPSGSILASFWDVFSSLWKRRLFH